GLILYNSPRLTLYALLPLPILSVSVAYFGKRIHHRFEEIQAHFARISAMVQEDLSGVRVVRAYAREDHETERFDRMNREYVAKNQVLIRLWSFSIRRWDSWPDSAPWSFSGSAARSSSVAGSRSANSWRSTCISPC